MKYTLKIFFVILFSSALLIAIIWMFSSAERLYALNQYLTVNQNSANAVQYTLQENIERPEYKDAENNIDYQLLVNSLPKYDFDSVSILSKSGTVIASTDSKIRDAFINTLGDDGKEAFFVQAGTNFVLNGNSYYFAKAISEDYRVMCIILESEILIQKTKISSLNAVQVLIIMLIIGMCITLIIACYKQKFDVLYKVKPVNNYTVTTTKGGSILYTDDNFYNTFGRVKFHKSFPRKDITLKDALTSGQLLLFPLKNKDGEERQIAFNATGALGQYKLVGSDVTDFMQEHNNLVHSFESDSQTGLANEYPFERDWKEFIAKDTYIDGLMCFFGMNNVDYYRTLYGEENFLRGQKYVYKIMSEKLAKYGKMYAIKGCKFLLIRTKELREEFIKDIRQIRDSLCETINIYNNFIKLDMRLGIIYLTELKNDTNLDYVFNAGMKALKYAKEIENVPYYIQRGATFDASNYQLVTPEVLNELITKSSIDVYFQPQIDVKTEHVVGFEALFRFTDIKLQDLSVFDFIASAEEHGCIIELGEFIYKKAMDFASLVQKFNLTVSINISPIQLMQMGFVEKFLQEYEKHNIKPGIIHIEIVESTMIYSINDVIQKLEILKKNGIVAEVDDFGIAYSSMIYLKNLPITTIKIDKAFIDNIENNAKDRNLIKNIINITKDFGFKSVAEGVERKGQKDILASLGCDIIQGFYYSKAIPKEKVFNYIKKMNNNLEGDKE